MSGKLPPWKVLVMVAPNAGKGIWVEKLVPVRGKETT